MRSISVSLVIVSLALGLCNIAIAAPPEGALIKGSGPEVYVILSGQRRHIPNPETFVAMGYRWGDIQTIPDHELGIIPLGAPLPHQGPLKFHKEDNFGDFHMVTDITISKNGRFDAVTETNNHVHLKGNCGTVTVWLLDKDGNVLSRHGGQQYCTDGKSMPFGAPAVRKHPWEFVIPANVLPQVGGVSIMHAEGSKNFFDLIGGHIEKAKSVLLKCPECAAYFAP
jgi:hypothetical protein